MDQALSRKERSHGRIVEAAARAIRRHGYAGVGVADVMKEAGLTHGGFYAHFESRDALLVAAIEHAGRRSAELIAQRRADLQQRGVSPFRTLVEGYLSDEFLKSTDSGCPVATLCSEMPRQGAEVREASAARVRSLVAYVERSLPVSVPAERAGVIAATLVGSLQLARAIGDADRGRRLLADARQALLDQYDLR
jgi:AcrR family transcriptional regulator